MLKNKMKPLPETVNGIRFDSRLEALAYRYLCLEFGKSRITCHDAIGYTSDSSLLPELIHKVDFTIRDSEGVPMRYLEIKGTIDSNFHGKAEYIRTLMLLETLRPCVFNKYVLWVDGGELRFNKKMDYLPYALRFPLNPQSIKADLMLG